MPGSVTVALLGDPEVAASLAKKSTQSDVTLYHAVHDDHALTLVAPTQYPEKFPPLLYAIGLADRAVFVVPALDRGVAETAATLDLFPIPVEVRHGPNVGAEEIRRAFRGLRLADSPIAPLDLVRLRGEVEGYERTPLEGPVQVPIDHAFPVKGVGTVALGFVRRGTLSAHAQLELCPTGRTIEVRSIQVHDVDVPSASSGTRVGVALKGIDPDELSRGMELVAPGSRKAERVLRLTGGRKCPYYRGDLVAGAHLQALVGTQLVPAVLTEFRGSEAVLEADRPVACGPGERVVLADLSAPQGPRCAAGFDLAA